MVVAESLPHKFDRSVDIYSNYNLEMLSYLPPEEVIGVLLELVGIWRISFLLQKAQFFTDPANHKLFVNILWLLGLNCLRIFRKNSLRVNAK